MFRARLGQRVGGSMRTARSGRGSGRSRSGRLLALGLVLSILASACGGGDDDTETTAATDALGTSAPADETGAETGATETSAATEATEEAVAEGPVTLGDDSRLVSGQCAEGTRNADEALGLTDDTINIAMVGIDLGALADIGLAPSDIDVTAAGTVFVDAINDAGGICGRTIDFQPVQYDFLAAEGGRACTQVTEERRNALVLGQGSWNEATCVAESGTVVVSQQDFTEPTVAVEGLLFATPPSVEETTVATVEHFLPDLQARQPVGVWYGAVLPGHAEAVEQAVFPILDDAGVDYVAHRTDAIGPSDPAGAAVLSAAATDFVAHAVGAVLGFTQTTNHVGLQVEMAAQQHIPTWLWSNVGSNGSNELFADVFGVTGVADGERLMSYTLPPAYDAENPWTVSCNEQFQARGGEVYEPGSFEYAAVANVCLQFDVLVAVLTTVGPEITNEALVAAIEGLPPFYVQGAVQPVEFGPGDRFANHTMVELLYDGASNSFSVNSDPIELG
jgi:hypothetical protein